MTKSIFYNKTLLSEAFLRIIFKIYARGGWKTPPRAVRAIRETNEKHPPCAVCAYMNQMENTRRAQNVLCMRR
jgi:hypothetical protein